MLLRPFGFCVGIFLLHMSGNGARAGDLITEPEAGIYLAPTIYNGTFSNFLGDRSVANPSWHVVQWNNPNPLPGTGTNFSVSAGSSWQASNSTTRVAFYAAPGSAPGGNVLEHTYELAQNGQAGLTCGAEYDLFIEAESNSTSYKDLKGDVAAQRFQTSAPVGNLSNLSLSFGLNISYETIAQNCSLNYGSYEVALTLGSTKGPAMFYQIFLRDSRGGSADQNNSPCGGYPQGQVYCFTTSQRHLISGATDQAVGGGRVAYNFNFLSSVIAAIKLTSDPNPADWSVGGMYFGQSATGGTINTSRWDTMTLTAY